MAITTSGFGAVQADGLNIEEVELALETHIDNGLAVGMVVGIIDDGQSYIIGLGRAAKGDNQEINEHSIFEIGSISKTFTGLLLADMVRKGEVKLSDPVMEYLPDIVEMPMRGGKQITLLDLATHRSGLPRLPDNMAPEDINNPYADYSVADLYDFLAGYKLPRDIGTEAEYSNLGVGLLGHVLALKASLNYGDLLQRNILTPLGMDDSGIELNSDQLLRFTTGYGMAGEATAHWDLPVFAGAGALRSTGADMMVYLRANIGLAASPLADAIKLSHDIKSEFDTPQMQIGLAWLNKINGEQKTIWHNGGTGGYRSFIGFDERSGRGVFVLSNSQDDVDAIGWALLEGRVADLRAQKIIVVENAAQYTGDYQLAADFILTVSHADGQLFVQATGQGKNAIYMKSKNEFYFKVVDAQISFERDENGVVTGLTLHQNGEHFAKKT
ncbi:MAG: serine hydrolase [Alphaproteobacteria bacterium]|nr:serine hydrolase [Alphaproteobacteria bacterium]